MTGEDSTTVWTDCPEAIHNPAAIKLLGSGLLTRHMLCTSVVTSQQILYIYFNISSVQFLSF